MKKGWVWFLSIVLILFTLGYGVKFFFSEVSEGLHNSEPYNYAIKKASNNNEVLSILGRNIQFTKEKKEKDEKKASTFKLSFGSEGVDFGITKVDLKIVMKSEKGKGFLIVKGKKEKDKWNYEEISFTENNTHKKINLLKI